MIAAKSCDFHSFAYIRIILALCEKKYNFRAISGIPITQTGLYRHIRTCYFLEWILPSVCFYVKTGLYRLFIRDLDIIRKRLIFFNNWKPVHFNLTD